MSSRMGGLSVAGGVGVVGVAKLCGHGAVGAVEA